MLIKKDALRYAMPEFSDIINIVITSHTGLLSPLQRVDQKAMEQLRKEMKTGMPRFYTVKDQDVHFYPRADKDYGATIRYLPPAQEI